MTPVHFGECFGWLHLPPSGSRNLDAGVRSRAVVMCASLGREATAIHRPWLLLADQIAAAGLPVLRFDYPGTADSTRDEGEPLCLADWVDSVKAATGWVKQHTGASEIALCGIRAGGALALMAAPRIDELAAIALLAPVTSWARFLREQELLAGVFDTMWMVKHPVENAGWWEAAGLRLSRVMLDEMRAASIRLDRPPARRALILASEDSRSDRRLADRLSHLGTEATLEAFPGRASLMHDDLENSVPQGAFSRVVCWLREGAPATPRYVRPQVPGCIMTMPKVRETVIRIGADERLFGMLCEPREHAPSAAVMIFNTGAVPHYGQSRLAVTFARRLAHQGVASLRMDASGLGDSSPATGHERKLFSDAWLDEARQGTEWLRNRIKGPLILFGICSGGYAALHLALGEPAVRGLVVANMQHFVHDETTPLRVQQRSTRSLRHYGRRLRSPAAWQRFVRGGIPFGNLMRAVAKTARDQIGSIEQRERRRMVTRWFEHLNARRVPVRIAYGPCDAGIDDLEKYFGPEGRLLKTYSNVKVGVVPNADHAFSHFPDREQLYAILLEVLAAAEALEPQAAWRDAEGALEAAD